ncbi:MAG: hypothetical protein KDC00_11625 [Flavobacteriales bacterium]|nr:hypothetical protein [Flavobacteriales bacterium]
MVRLSILTASLFIAMGLTAQQYVVLKGQVIVPEHIQNPVELTMDVGDTSCVRVELYGRGRFQIETADLERYELRFEQEGSLTKSVTVDTKNAKKKIGSEKRVIAFDVQLEPLDSILPMKYAGPVGDINFHHSNGRMVVDRDPSKVLTSEVTGE